MANKSRVTNLLMLLFMTWGKSARCHELTVDPPEDLRVSDPGRLGYLDISWNPPSSLINVTTCQIQYQLEYLDTFNNRWAALRTSGRSYSARFDLSKDIAVRVHTMLNGNCTDNVMHMSENSTQLILKPPSTGIVDTEARDFKCVFHNMEWVECDWTRGLKTPSNSQQNLYFWYKSLEQAAECPNYILSGGVRRGCSFQGNALPKFTDIIFCVNGSSPEGPLKPTFASLQIQNYLKPAALDKLDLQTSLDGQLQLLWQNPVMKLPGYCLEWEVRCTYEGPDGEKAQRNILTEETSLILPSSDDSSCFQVRSKLSQYCVDKSLWSEWSPKACRQSEGVTPCCSTTPFAVKEVDSAPELNANLVPAYVYVAVAVIVVLVLSLCVWAAINMKKLGQEKQVDSLLTSLLAKTFAVTKTFGGKNVCSDAVV